MRSLPYLLAIGLTTVLAAGCGAITGEKLGGTGGSGAGGAVSGTGGQGGGLCGCDQIYQPVCGVNGVTYANSCEASCAGVAVASQGACVDGGTISCSSDSDCIPAQTSCCIQSCVAKGTAVPVTICNASCTLQAPFTCACVNHQCVTEPGAGGQGGGAGGTGGGGGAGGADGGPSCGDLAAEYAAALPDAETCNPGSVSSQCQQLVSPSLSPCFANCPTTYVNDATQLNAIKAIWLEQKCNDVVVLCPAIACLQPTAGLCVAGDGGGGRCQSATGVAAN